MPKILKRIIEPGIISDQPVVVNVIEVPMIEEEPDHAPEIEAAQAYEVARAGVRLRGIPGPDDTPETGTEPTEMQLPEVPAPEFGRSLTEGALSSDRRGWSSPATDSDIDPDHDCDQPSHSRAWMTWYIEHGFPPSRDYTTCRGYRRLRARHVSEIQ